MKKQNKTKEKIFFLCLTIVSQKQLAYVWYIFISNNFCQPKKPLNFIFLHTFPDRLAISV
jgi:hypothetical protein